VVTTFPLAFHQTLACQFLEAIRTGRPLQSNNRWSVIELMTLAGCIQFRFAADPDQMTNHVKFEVQPLERQEAMLMDHREAVAAALLACGDLVGAIYNGAYAQRFTEHVMGTVRTSVGRADVYLTPASYLTSGKPTSQPIESL
jgi:hypothetical protein